MSQICPVCNNEAADNAATCPSCGFKLAGSTQRFQPVALEDETFPAPAQAHQHAEFKVVRGPQTGVTIELKEGSLTIGRNPQCDIFLNDMTVSRKHATVEVMADGCVIEDTNSYNGVWVNDEPVERRRLQDRDLIQIGTFCLLYQER